MENFFYYDDFYSDLGELMDTLEYYEEKDIVNLPDGYTVNITEARLEPLFELSVDWILDKVKYHRWPEDDNIIGDKTCKVLRENINFDKINSLLPKLYYKGVRKFTITKADMLEYI